MAANVLNNLFPPIIATWMPAFIRTTPCKVYFSLSPYNTLSAFKASNNAQVIISSQNSSLSALDSSKYPAEIMLAAIKEDGDVEGGDKYYITIEPSDLKDGYFEVGQYYKVQIRFTGAAASDPPTNGKIAGWLTDNQGYFSEWSTVCLIRGIQQPQIHIKGFEDTITDTETIFYTEVLQLVGEMYYDENSSLEDEYLKSYEVSIYEEDSGLLAFNSGIVYTNEFYPNEINYLIKYNLEDGIRYTITLTYTTNNEYTSSWTRNFSVVTRGIDKLNANITAEAEPVYGRIAVNVTSTLAAIFTGNLCIRRTSNETDFTIWEDIHIETLQGKQLDYTWYDYTVQSGIYYKYCVQQVNGEGDRGPIVSIRYPVMVYFEDIFLTRDEFQLTVKFDPTIASFKTKFVESETETLGSKYPFIRRNGNVAYKTFPISGLITSFCDEDHIFGTSRQDFYGEDMIDYYDKFNTDTRTPEYQDFIYEKFFRDKVIDFLQKNDMKLFRSQTEGNILIKLTDISFTPNQTLGRMLYNFEATAYEMDECTIENYEKYGILDLGHYDTLTDLDFQSIEQLSGTYSTTNLLQIIQKQHTLTASAGFIDTIQYLTWIRIQFESAPYLIKSGTNKSLTPATKKDTADENMVNGYIVYINGEPVLVSGRRYFELGDDDTKVTSVWFPVDTDISFDYMAQIHEEENKSVVASTMTFSFKVGQLWGTFDVDSSVSKAIYLKYWTNYSTYYLKLLSIDSLTIEAVPGAVVYVKDSFDDDYYRHEIGYTGSLRLQDDEATIDAFYFCGVHLIETVDENRLDSENGGFRETGIVVDTIDEIGDDPISNGVYTILGLDAIALVNIPESEEDSPNIKTYINLLQDKITSSDHRFIYYKNQWYVFTADNDVMCPVQGVVDYVIELVKGEY